MKTKLLVILYLFYSTVLTTANAEDLLPMPLSGAVNKSLAKKDSGITFNIQNATGKKITNISVTTGNGTKIYEGAYVCAADSQNGCPALPQISLAKPPQRLIFKLTGDGNKIIAAYIWQYRMGTNFSLYTDASDIMDGGFVKHQMRFRYSKYKNNPGMLNTQLAVLFKNYTEVHGQIDIFTKLGLYFKQSVINGSLAEDQFYTQLDNDLSNGTTLDKDLLSSKINAPTRAVSRLLAMSATANSSINANANTNEIASTPAPIDTTSSFCAKTDHDILTYSSFFASFIPIFGGQISQSLLTANNSLSAVCATHDSTISDLIDSINKMKARIDELYVSLDAMNYSIVDLYAQVAKNQTTNIKLLLDIALANFDNKFDFYNGIFWDKNPTNANHKNKTLFDYTKNTVTKPTQFAAFYNDNKNFNFRELLNSTGAQIDLFNALFTADQLIVLRDSLKKTCADAYGITGDVFAERIRCNLIMKEASDIIEMSALKFKKMLKDQIDVVSLADPAWVQSANLKFDNGATQWEDAKARVDEIVDTKIRQVKDALLGPNGENIFKVLDGFPSTLATNMIANHCYTESNVPDPSDPTGAAVIHIKLPGVIEWHTQTTESDPYIVAICSDGQDNNIKSTYHFKNGYNVANILGILLPYPAKTTEASSITIPVANDDYGGHQTMGNNSYHYTTHKFTFKLDFKQPNYNLKMNSSAYKGMWQTPFYVQQGNSDQIASILDDAHSTGRTYRLTNFTYDVGNSFLQPVTPIDDKTLSFQSTVYGITSNNSLLDWLQVDGKVYFSISQGGNTYIFGLAIVNYDAPNMFALPTEKINLECFVGTTCSVSGRGVKWPDGTLVYMFSPDGGRTIHLAVDNQNAS